MILRMFLMLVFVGAVLGGVFGFRIYEAKQMFAHMAAMGVPAQTVSTTKAAKQSWQKSLEAVGSLRASKGVDVAAEVSGIVTAIGFNSGENVKAGALLVQLRTDDDIAKLKALQAAAALAKINYDRDSRQYKIQAVSRAAVDADKAALESDEAQVKAQQAVIAEKTIAAPFDGTLGIRQVDLGQYLNPGAPVVTLQALDAMFVDFLLPQQALSEIRIGQAVTLKNDTWPGKSFTGTITTINPKVDTATRNVQVRARVPNADHALLPGMYATVDIVVGAPQSFITLPQTAITYNPYGDTVYLAEKDKDGKPVARQVFVTVGETRGDQIQVLTGVKVGDAVVTSGQIKLRNGAPIAINNAITPTDDAHPTPSEQ
ncbi:MAG: efflux RND transporter periplasmic adaptor subunit [Alphaproteobacteria bacterium]|nr:efflux RND transporter periplasmic adaptor subunit [Alphaproteobacteria bacterium]MDE2336445.1 efflux RND transporter periplasmic adaptor subunit [Alphaproteobacteria bacterium]